MHVQALKPLTVYTSLHVVKLNKQVSLYSRSVVLFPSGLSHWPALKRRWTSEIWFGCLVQCAVAFRQYISKRFTATYMRDKAKGHSKSSILRQTYSSSQRTNGTGKKKRIGSDLLHSHRRGWLVTPSRRWKMINDVGKRSWWWRVPTYRNGTQLRHLYNTPVPVLYSYP
jgi:hypothetical protein